MKPRDTLFWVFWELAFLIQSFFAHDMLCNSAGEDQLLSNFTHSNALFASIFLKAEANLPNFLVGFSTEISDPFVNFSLCTQHLVYCMVPSQIQRQLTGIW